MRKLVHGFGINDIGQSKTEDGAICPYYNTWTNMLKRCYLKSYSDKHPTYKTATVCDEWLTFSNFKAWMQQQDWEGMHLDKDMLVQNNRLYCPEFCTFLPSQINTILLDCGNKDIYSLGAYRRSLDNQKPWRAQISSNGRESRHIGCFSTKEEANFAWREVKFQRIYNLIGWWSSNDSVYRTFNTKIADNLLRFAWTLILNERV